MQAKAIVYTYMTGGVHMAQFQFLHDSYLTVNKEK